MCDVSATVFVRYLAGAGSMLGRRRRRWPSIKPAQAQRFVCDWTRGTNNKRSREREGKKRENEWRWCLASALTLLQQAILHAAQNAVNAHCSSKHLLYFGSGEQYRMLLPSAAGGGAQQQIAIPAFHKPMAKRQHRLQDTSVRARPNGTDLLVRACLLC